MGSDGSGDSFAASESGADELVGVGAVDLRAGRALGGAAGPAGDGQDAAGLVDGRVAVEQFAGGTVDVIDAATQKDGLQASSGVPDCACGVGGSEQRRYSSRRALAGGGGRAEASRAGCLSIGLCDQRCFAASGLAGLACRSVAVMRGFGTVQIGRA